jgi:hypothetical protein
MVVLLLWGRMKNENIDLNENKEGLCIKPEYHSFLVVPLL